MAHPDSHTTAVIDIGSNTIKLLVADKDPASEKILIRHRNTLEARIGTGINQGRLPQDAIERGAEAVAALVQEARRFSPRRIRIVGTSAVRDAKNKQDFADAIAAGTGGISLEVLSGEREAELIGEAVRLDERITARNFYIFDLGGGSLECLAFADGVLLRTASLPLGAVRLTEKCVAAPREAFTDADKQAVDAEVLRVFVESPFAFSLPPDAIAVATGGTATTALTILAGREKVSLEERDPFLSRADLTGLLDWTAARGFDERLTLPGLTPGRADVFPAALAILLRATELAGIPGVHYSPSNLRLGIAAADLRSLENSSAATPEQIS